MTTPDARLVVAYSSVAQLGFIMLGVFSLRPQGVQGALLQMVNHALVTAPLFFIVAALAVRAGGSEKLSDMGGIAFRAPVLAALFIITTFVWLAMPGSSNFVGEFMILLGLFNAKMPIALVASAGVVGAAVYALRAYIRSMHNRTGPRVNSFDLSIADALPVIGLLAVILVLAFYPQFGLKRSEPTVTSTLAPAQAQLAASAATHKVAQVP
jgi:NADH-quinone oxidoreductase subunit M